MSKLNLKNLSTKADKSLDKESHKNKSELLFKRLGELQELMFAEGKHALLVVLQGMDGSGKDGAVRDVFSAVNPAGCMVHSFKKPSDEELAHDFLWRIHQRVPAKGYFAIFNRSHYEDVLIQRVHHWIDEETVKRRFDSINDFEKHLRNNHIHLLKFYLHISKAEQLERLQERKTNPLKMWKFNENDLKEREHWDAYQDAYEDVLNECNTIPWHIIPADQNWYKEFLIAKTLVDYLEKLNMQFPKLNS